MIARLVAPIGFIIALVALAFVMQSLGDKTPMGQSINQPELLKQFEIVEIAAPEATVTDSDEKKVDLASMFIKPTLITFWTVNCGECNTGLPILDNFAKIQSEIALILISVRDEPIDAREKLQSLKIALGSYYDRDGSVFQNWEATMPASYYVVNGKIKYFFPGRIADEHLQALLTVQ